MNEHDKPIDEHIGLTEGGNMLTHLYFIGNRSFTLVILQPDNHKGVKNMVEERSTFKIVAQMKKVND